MQTCKTCAWWRNTPRYLSDRTGVCDMLGDLAGTPGKEVVLTVIVANDTCDDPDTAAQLRTGPEFGCVHHRPEGY